MGTIAAIWTALKSLTGLADFIRWAAEFVRSLVVESKKQHADTQHDENAKAIDSAFPDAVPTAASAGVPDGSADGSCKATPGSPAIAAGAEVRPPVGP